MVYMDTLPNIKVPPPPPSPPDPLADIKVDLGRLKNANQADDLESFKQDFTYAWLGKSPDQRHSLSVFKGCIFSAQQNHHLSLPFIPWLPNVVLHIWMRCYGQ